MKGSFVSEKFKIEDSSYSLLCQHLPGITEDNNNRYSEINTSLGLDLNTRPPKLQPHPLTAIFVNE